MASLEARGRLEIEVNGEPAEVVRTPGGVVARSLLCSHFGCRVQWQEDARHYHCPCHEGRFDAEGRPIGGPPLRPLRAVPVEVAAAISSSASDEPSPPRRDRRVRLRRPSPPRGPQGGLPDLRHRPPLAGPLRGAGPPEHHLAPGRHRRAGGHRADLRRDPEERRGRHPRPPRGPLRLHGRRAPRVPAHERRGAAERPRALAGARPPAIRLLELHRGLPLPAARGGPHRGEPAGRGPRLRPDEGHRRADARGVPRPLPVDDRPLRRALLGLVRVPAPLHVPRDLALVGMERADPRGTGPVGDPVPARRRPDPLLPRPPRPPGRRAARPGPAREPRRSGLPPAALRRGDARPLRKPAALRPHAAASLRPGDVGPRPPGAAHREAALRATLDGPLHRPRNDDRLRRTRALLGWEPRPRLQVLRRLPFLLENRRTDPIEWNRATAPR